MNHQNYGQRKALAAIDRLKNQSMEVKRTKLEELFCRTKEKIKGNFGIFDAINNLEPKNHQKFLEEYKKITDESSNKSLVERIKENIGLCPISIELNGISYCKQPITECIDKLPGQLEVIYMLDSKPTVEIVSICMFRHTFDKDYYDRVTSMPKRVFAFAENEIDQKLNTNCEFEISRIISFCKNPDEHEDCPLLKKLYDPSDSKRKQNCLYVYGIETKDSVSFDLKQKSDKKIKLGFCTKPKSKIENYENMIYFFYFMSR